MLVIGPDHPVKDNGYRKIVVAVDLSEDSTTLLQEAAAMAHTDNVELRVLHVCEPHSLL